MIYYLVLVLGGSLFMAVPLQAAATDMVVLHQTACQFVEAEGGNQHYSARTADACRQWNDATADKRLAMHQPLHLPEGDVVFRVYNDDVPYLLGFWLRGEGFSRLSLPSVSGGNIAMGHYKDYNIRLEAGHYRYSCSLNPTPAYALIVEEDHEEK